MTTRVTDITWSETGGTRVNGVYQLATGATVTLAITFHNTGGGTDFTPTTGDYIVLSNGGHAVYNGTNWVYTVSASDTHGDLSYSTADGDVVVYNKSGTELYSAATQGRFALPSSPTTTYDVVCFLAGTMIATPAGEMAVEYLKAGDLLTLATGGSAVVTWLGRQTVSTRFADPLRVQPIRVSANALADGVPSRDLLVSPDHALLVDGVLVHASALVNGVSIMRETETAETLTYYHVEVAEHALILAENTPAETFIDNADRMNFDNWDEHPGDVQLTEMDLPRAKSARQIPTDTRIRLADRAEALFGLRNTEAA